MPTRSLMLPAALALFLPAAARADFTRNIMVTGYWPQSNNIIRPWSANPAQNPSGWTGGNWEGRGYNVYSYFPEFPGQNGPDWGKGQGDFEVDYQDTSADFWRITAQVRPCAIITFSRGNADASWEIESRNRNRSSWVQDYQQPFLPDQTPPDPTWPVNGWRESSLPMENIRAAVNAANLGVNAFIDRGLNGGGNFLSEYLGYHGLWYKAMHSGENDPSRMFAAGHIHVGIPVSQEAGTLAAEITMRQLMDYLDTVIPAPGTCAVSAPGLVLLSRRRRGTH